MYLSLITKAEITSIDYTNNTCTVNMPLFQNASSTSTVSAEALINITPGFFNNLFIGDIVFVGFEENALEKPIILGKLYRGTSIENETPGGAGILDTLKVTSSATIPASTLFKFSSANKSEYSDLQTPKNMADYIKAIEANLAQLESEYRAFVENILFRLRPENLEIDDGDIDRKKS